MQVTFDVADQIVVKPFKDATPEQSVTIEVATLAPELLSKALELGVITKVRNAGGAMDKRGKIAAATAQRDAFKAGDWNLKGGLGPADRVEARVRMMVIDALKQAGITNTKDITAELKKGFEAAFVVALAKAGKVPPQKHAKIAKERVATTYANAKAELAALADILQG